MIIKCLDEDHGQDYALYNGDCVDILRQIPDKSVGFSAYSPPFENIFCYSDSQLDMGNNANGTDFREHYGYMVEQLTRVMKPGRLAAIHCSDLPLTKWRDGVVGMKDFPSDLRQVHEDFGWTYHCKITVWKDPVVEVTRTKALGLLYKQLQKDSIKSRVGMPDYIVVMRAPGENSDPVGQDARIFPVEQWQQWASPVWMDIRQTDTLNVQLARENSDERHVCPLQLGLIERAISLWSNRGDVVLSPFAGIGSEGVSAIKLRRKFIGVELKGSYFNVATKNLKEAQSSAVDLFDAA